ncbi:MAG: CBS domain-containing protein [Polyangiales bacterium]
MTVLTDPVEKYMSSPVQTVTADDDVSEAARVLREADVSSLAVVGRDGSLAGVISFADLLQMGHVLGRMTGGRTTLTLPSSCVGDVMTLHPVFVPHDATLLDAAKKMLEKRIHRVFVMRANELAGVVSTRDLMLAVADAKIATPIAQYMSKPVLTVPAHETLARAVERLAKAGVSGLVVMDEEQPSGLFTQLEAVAARDLPPSTRVEEVVEYSVICLPWRTPLYRAAAFAANTRARRVLAMDGTEIRGILTALDFVKAALDPEPHRPVEED